MTKYNMNKVERQITEWENMPTDIAETELGFWICKEFLQTQEKHFKNAK